MFDELDQYQNNGHFFFQKGDSLKQVTENVPNLPGVYYILRLSHGKIDLVYIGKSGTLKPDGNFRSQLLRKRLNNKQNGIKRQEFFDQKITEEGIDALDIYWFVTFDENNRDLPGYVEGLLIQRFFEVYKRLPEWNREY